MGATAKTFWSGLVAFVGWLAAVDALALAEPPVLASGSPGDAQTNEGHSLSADGRFVVFSSFATNLVVNDNNGLQDVFLWDTVADTVELVSHSVTGVAGNGDSSLAVISADGVWIAFLSVADNLTTDTNGSVADVFLYNRLESTIELVSVSATGEQSLSAADNPDINANGRYVTFDTIGNLAPGAGATVRNVLRRDNWRNTTELVSRTPDGMAGNDMSFNAQMSANGERIVFVSMASDLVATPTVGKDSFLYDAALGETTLLSLNDQGNAGDGTSYFPTISGDGRVAAFHSFADNLASSDAAGRADIFLRDLQTGLIELISSAPLGMPADSDSIHPALDFNGNRVAYLTFAGNLVANSAQGRADAVLFDRTTATTTLLSQADDGSGGNGDSAGPSISLDGVTQVLSSRATNLSTNGTPFSDVLLTQNAAAAPVTTGRTLYASAPSVIGSELSSGCKVVLDSSLDVDFSYQLTDPLSNAAIGVRDQEFLLLPGVAQSLVFTLRPNVALEQEELAFAATCKLGSAPVVAGTNTLLMSAETTQPPDVVALVATLDNDGILKLPADGAASAFSVASINLGSADAYSVRPVVTGAALDAVSICQTNPVSGACLATPTEAVAVTINTGQTPTFGVFVANQSRVTFAPAVNRLFVQFEDNTGAVRGRTSVAIVTIND